MNFKLTARNSNKKAGCMLQIDQDIEGTLLYSSRRALSLVASSGSTPLLSEPSTGCDGQGTVEYQLEGHAEVISFVDIPF